MRILVVNWQDRENPLAGGAEIHLHEIFERLAGRGHEVTLLCGGWPGCPPRVTLGGMDVQRVGTRQTFALRVFGHWRRELAARPFDVIVEDINKAPLYTPAWGARARIVADLEARIPDFSRAYEPDGMTPAEFDAYGATARTLRGFIKAYHDLVGTVNDIVLPNPDVKR